MYISTPLSLKILAYADDVLVILTHLVEFSIKSREIIYRSMKARLMVNSMLLKPKCPL